MDDCDVADLQAIIEVDRPHVTLDVYQHASEIASEVVLYDRQALPLSCQRSTRQVEAEMQGVLRDGPGILVIRGAFEDLGVVDEASRVFRDIIAAEEEDTSGAKGDHFATAGANSRIWNALEKLAVQDPDVFVRYYANEIIALASRAWLGPHYQVTSQVNVVHPGGGAQEPHRDST